MPAGQVGEHRLRQVALGSAAGLEVDGRRRVDAVVVPGIEADNDAGARPFLTGIAVTRNRRQVGPETEAHAVGRPGGAAAHEHLVTDDEVGDRIAIGEVVDIIDAGLAVGGNRQLQRAAVDDGVSVYRDLLETYDPGQIALFGSSAGGGLAAAFEYTFGLMHLPGALYVVAVVAAARGIEIDYGMLAEPNYALPDHIVTGAYDRKLAEGWDYVVLQQGPSSLPENRELLRVWAVRAAESARARGTRVVMFSAWPARGNAFTWMDAELSYQLAARATGGCIAPIATAWRYARAGLPGVDVYSGDDLHASEAGTLLAAQVIVRSFVVGRYMPTMPLAPDEIEDPLWRDALSHATELDAFARRAVADIAPRCSLAKSLPGVMRDTGSR